MKKPQTAPHVYQREVGHQTNDSLGMLAQMIEPGQTVLDLGMGTGALGRHLSEVKGVTIDGLTLSEEEARLARTHYRQVLVANLDDTDLTALFDAKYDRIVCADVLEHLKHPEHVLQQCRHLLKEDGQVLTSVPNAGYCGLMAELLVGEWRYREEGLLDHTHLRFFTRRSLNRFFAATGWHSKETRSVPKSLVDSEFRVGFDLLPPAVSRHLLALPDAGTYQFIDRLVPISSIHEPEPSNSAAKVSGDQITGHFTAQLYLGTKGCFNETDKWVSAGTMGATTTLRFNIAALADEPYTALRLDPADRPGFMRLHRLELLNTHGTSLWHWAGTPEDWAVLDDCKKSALMLGAPWGAPEQAWLTFLDDDPWLILPIPDEALVSLSKTGGVLHMYASWPMSADYLQAQKLLQEASFRHVQAVNELLQQIDDLRLKHHAELQTAQTLYQQAAQTQAEEMQSAQNKLQLLQTQADQHASRNTLLLQEKAALLGHVRDKETRLLKLHNELEGVQAYVRRIESSKLFRMTRPLAQMKYAFDQWRKPASAASLDHLPAITSALHRPLTPVDIIVPVYRGLEDTRRSIESVLTSTCQTPWRLIIINDCSPEPQVSEWLREVAQRDTRIELLENTENLGFVATVNRGMRLHEDRDVLLLNSDTEVANDWLDRLQAAAFSRSGIASVTPFSNNATICSYPRFCQANEMPDGWTTAELDVLCAQHLAGQTVRIPTAVGFCMYIRRTCLQEVGYFDEVNFGKGYGEENDFCVRATSAGWTHLHALNVFVRHAGGISFGDSKSAREIQAMFTLKRLHPHYDASVHHFIGLDPAAPARERLDLARIVDAQRPLVVMVTHNRIGGTLRHVQEMAQWLAEKATCLMLRPGDGGLTLSLPGIHEAWRLQFNGPDAHEQLLVCLRSLGVSHVHYHHLLGHEPRMFSLAQELGVTHDFTAHDYYSYCPQISLTTAQDRYCGEQGLSQCAQCLAITPAPDGSQIEDWRARYVPLLSAARYVIAPSQDTAARIQRFVPQANVVTAPHAQLDHRQSEKLTPSPAAWPAPRPLKIVLLGGLSRIKGADVLEQAAMLAARQGLPLEFHLLGYSYRHLATQPKAALTVHGAYEDADLPQLLRWLAPDMAWFPAQWPETYSYTLSACLDASLPVVTTNLGAPVERLRNHPWSWVLDWETPAKDWTAFFCRIREEHFLTGKPPAVISSSSQLPACTENFDYRTHYLNGLPSCQPLLEVPALTQAFGHARELAHKQLKEESTQRKALRILEKLKHAPLLSWLSRLVPTATQRKIKTWLTR